MRAYRIAYDGRPYYGFQRQPDVPTVEGELLDALSGLGVVDAEDGSERDVPPGYAAAGRTDAGVSALAQTIAFEAPEWLTPAAFNSELPASVRAWASAEVDEAFHATHHAERRTYTYWLHAADADTERARTAIEELTGRHDFHNLTNDDENTVRELSASLRVDSPFFVLTLRAGGFCRQLVRRVVALVREVASGEAGREKIERVLGADPIDGPEGVGPAPPYPLVLTDVSYPGVAFDVDAEAAASAREVFREKRLDRAAGARVAGQIEAGIGEG
ncbi:tRNA pseudouridine38-40 synthase [Natronoarchaeum philippinense]|uniref:tRNA pseudouridine synthase A n=1 Tax=Natronoarchaeum philippinense TaxID=558529 RepID=A0A285P6Z3_NATPI|nr:tRNA pseudouridine(38-40) synthase TruA [Natronoarchaeum philippinense]SNZ15896.1 tRNA pseudouridine38-40 synthase [Natronoarchaeum philippinense]